MLRFDNIIRNLSLEEKIELITNDSYGNKTIPNYELPTFEIATKLNKMASGVVLPTFSMLGQTWNEELVKDFAVELSLNSVFDKQKILFGVPTEAKEDNEDRFGTAKYMIGKMAAAFIRGIEDGGSFACVNKIYAPDSFEEMEYRNKELIASEIAIKEGYPRAIVSEAPGNSNIISEELHYKGLKICEANDEADLIRSINARNHITLAYGLDAVEIVKDAIRKYKVASVELHKKVISKTTFDSLVRNGEILNDENIDLILDSLFEKLVNYIEGLQFPGKKISNEILKRVADESIVLLKNEGILPVDSNTEITLVGELATKPILNNMDCKKDVEYLSPLDVFNNEQLNLINFAYGYHSAVKDTNRLIEEALVECKKSRISVVYLGIDEEAAEDSYSLPAAQLRLLQHLYDNEISIIAVVATPKVIDMQFTDLCKAVILTGPNTLETIKSTVQIISGIVNPSGRLSMDYPYSIDKEGEKSLEIKYPLGYGLSYSHFEYRKFKLKHNGVSFVSENTGMYAGSDVIQLYVSQIINGEETKKELKGFIKYKLASNDYDQIFIPFDDKTFRSYDLENQCYCVKGGTYKVYVGRSMDNVEFETEVNLSSVLDKPNAYSYEVVESSDSFEDMATRFVDDNESKEAFFKELRGMPFKRKLTAAILIYIYLFLILGVTIFLGINSEISIPVIVTSVILFVIFTIGFIVYVSKSYKHKKKFEKLNTKSPINDMVNELSSFDVRSTEQFEIPKKTLDEEMAAITLEEQDESAADVIEEESEEAVEKETTESIEEESEEEVKEIEYVDCDFELSEDKLEYSKNLDLQELCAGFNSYALKNGLIIEQASIRLLISSILSNKLVFIRATRMDLLPKLVKLLNKYIADDDFIFDTALLETKSLIWKYTNGQFEQTDFAKALYQSKSYTKHFNIIGLNNIDVATMLDYFSEFYEYCSNPNESHKINMGSISSPKEFEIPKNLMFIAIPNSYDYLDKLPSNLALYSSSIEVQIRENEIIPDDDVTVKYYSYLSYCDGVRLEKDEYYLPEESWKKIDEFEEALDNESKFRIENKTILQIENLATSALLCGSDSIEALDFVLASKIVPIIKSYEPYVNGSTDNVVTKSIERYFEMDTIPNTLRALKKAD